MGGRNIVPILATLLGLAIIGMVGIVWLGQDFNPRVKSTPTSFDPALLATIPEGITARDFTFSRNGRVVAYIDSKMHENQIVFNDRPGIAFAVI